MHVPGWHEETLELQRAGELQMLGIVQEQNPDRAALFMQWQEMGWPILVDTFDLLEVSVVPLTYAIDEHGVVRLAGLRTAAAKTIDRDFLSRSWPAPEPTQTSQRSQTSQTSANATGALAPQAARALRDPGHIGRLVESLEGQVAVKLPSSSSTEQRIARGWQHFRLAAAHRLRYDSPLRQPQDFQAAVDHWQTALELDPNNYIWRRRLQQYGPRLDKPYPFYDWVQRAQREVERRGEQPVPLATAPTGSEIAQPAERGEEPTMPTLPFPDPEGRVTRDGARSVAQARGQAPVAKPLIRAEATLVPRRVQAGASTRLHLVLRPDLNQLAHWNNEVEPVRVWLELPPGWSASQTMLSHPNPVDLAVSTETRRLEAELTVAAPAASADDLRAVALYYVCEDTDGTCLYRRQDIALDVEVIDEQ